MLTAEKGILASQNNGENGGVGRGVGQLLQEALYKRCR